MVLEGRQQGWAEGPQVHPPPHRKPSLVTVHACVHPR
jgi:hypothetical protein